MRQKNHATRLVFAKYVFGYIVFAGVNCTGILRKRVRFDGDYGHRDEPRLSAFWREADSQHNMPQQANRYLAALSILASHFPSIRRTTACSKATCSDRSPKLS